MGKLATISFVLLILLLIANGFRYEESTHNQRFLGGPPYAYSGAYAEFQTKDRWTGAEWVEIYRATWYGDELINESFSGKMPVLTTERHRLAYQKSKELTAYWHVAILVSIVGVCVGLWGFTKPKQLPDDDVLVRACKEITIGERKEGYLERRLGS